MAPLYSERMASGIVFTTIRNNSDNRQNTQEFNVLCLRIGYVRGRVIIFTQTRNFTCQQLTQNLIQCQTLIKTVKYFNQYRVYFI
jgi:hypothetical protein